MTLGGNAKSHLKSLAHHLQPVVIVGKEGVTEGVVAAVVQALRTHELIKVKLPQLEKNERIALTESLVTGAEAHWVGSSGRIVMLYAPHPQKPKIKLPR